MAVIDRKKLLPPPKTPGSSDKGKFLVPISNVIPNSSSNVRGSDIQSEGEESRGQRSSVLFETIRIRKKVLKIENLINKNLKVFIKSEEKRRKLLERERFAKQENELEKKKSKKGKGFSMPSLPEMGFLDRIKRFLFFTTLGYVFTKFSKHIPKILGFIEKIKPVVGFFKDLTGNILNGIIDFVGAGYKVYEQVKGITKKIGGENFEKKFDEFSNQFNTFANLAIIAGMSTMGGTDFGLGGDKSPRSRKPGFDRIRGGRVNRETQSRYLSRYGKDAFVNRFGKKSLKQISTKGVGKLASKAFGRIPIIGGLIDFIISTVILKENPGRSAAKAVGATLGSALGTFIPIPFAGTILGGVIGDLLGGALYDTLVNTKGVESKSRGGQVTRGGKKVNRKARRSIKKMRRRPPKIQPQRTIPGKDIGGKKSIEKIFPSSIDKTKKDPLGLLETTSKNLKEIPMLGGLMGAAIDLVMGQKPDKSVFQKIGNGFGTLIQNAVDSKTSSTIENIQKQLVGLAGGGVVPRTMSTDDNIGMKIGEQISRSFETMVNSKINDTLQAIRRQLNLEGFGLTSGMPDGSADGELATGTVSRGQVTIEQLVGLAKGAGFSDSDAVIMAAIAMAESGGNSNAHNNKPPDNSYGLWQINMIGNLGPERRKQFRISSDEQLKDPVINAHAAKLIKKSQGFSAWTVYKTGKYKTYLPSAQKAASAPKITVYKPTSSKDFIPSDKNPGKFGIVQYVTGDVNYRGDGKQFYYDKAGHGMPGNYHDHIAFRTVEEKERAKKALRAAGIEIGSENDGKHAPGSYHYKNLAIDVPGHQWGGSGEIGQREFDGSRRVREILGLTAYEKGGKVHGLTRAMLGEKGPEFVLDADTTAALEQNFPGFLSSLNKANYKDALNVLRSYASYENTGNSIIMLQRVIVEKPVMIPSGNSGYIPSTIDSNNNVLESLTIG